MELSLKLILLMKTSAFLETLVLGFRSLTRKSFFAILKKKAQEFEIFVHQD